MAKLYVRKSDGTYVPQKLQSVTNIDVVQTTGDSQDKVMSQKAVTDALIASDQKLSELGYNFGFLNEGYFTKELQSLSFTDGEYIRLNASVGDVISLTPVSFYSATYAILNCQEGDIISARGGLNGLSSRLVGFIDSSNVLLFVTEIGLLEGIFIAPKNTAKCIVNGSIGKASAIHGTNIEISKWKNGLDELGDRLDSFEHSTNDRLDSFQNKVFVPGANLFNLATALSNKGVSSKNGTIVNLNGYMTSDFIPVDPSTAYTFKGRYVVVWYDENKSFLSSSPSSEAGVKTLTSPVGTKYMRFSFNSSNWIPNLMMVNKGDSLLPYEPYKEQFNPAYLDDQNKWVGYGLEIVNIKKPNGYLVGDPTNLCLIATKVIWEDGKTPNYTDFLYLDRTTQKLYISSGTPDDVQYLCDWDSSLVNGRECKYYMATITSDGDIIFLRDHARENPVVYPHGAYNNPYVIDFADNKKPYGALMHGSVVQFADGSFVFGDYAYHSLTDEQNNDGRIIWRVQKPYNNPDNWGRVHTFKHVNAGSPISDEPDNEIGHIHAINYDFYNDVLYCTTGDIDRHCRLWYSLDKGRTWGAVPNAVGWKQGDEGTGNTQTIGQKWRFTNMIFTKDYVYWATDSFFAYHELYRIQRNENGVIDASTLELICNLESVSPLPSGMSQATYNMILLRNPYGLLIIDRAEPRTDGMLDVKFYDLSIERLYVVGTLERATTDASSLDQETRIGLPNQCATLYQPETTDYVLIGGDTFIRPNNTSLFNNSIDNYVGALKIKVVAHAK